MNEVILNTVFQLKRGTAKAWERNNPLLKAGEPGFELDTNRLKIGDGITLWNDLLYIGESEVFNAATHFDFPSLGKENTIYKAEKEKKIYQWNTTSLIYEVISEGETTLDIELINGGNANG